MLLNKKTFNFFCITHNIIHYKPMEYHNYKSWIGPTLSAFNSPL